MKVSIESRDEILGALVRALSVQVAGFQAASGMNAKFLKQNGYYHFGFSEPQTYRFKSLVNEYLPNFGNVIKIEED